jgi:tripartite-type tricarboxylate transporter receptor subunit TctC
MVIPFAPGASNDITARLIAPKLSDALGQSVVVDNRGGAGGVLGADLVAKSQPDGYTLLMGSPGPLTVNPALLPNLPYQPKRDFVPVTLLAIVPSILEVNPALPVKSVQELIALARATPGKLNYASAGVGSVPHLAGELFKLLAKVEIVHVPYKGSSPAITDLMGGQVSMFFDNMASAVPYVKAGRLRALAITSPKRSAVMPDLPTMIEGGVPGYEAYSWNGVVAPAGTPPTAVKRLAAEIAAVLASPEIREKMKGLGAEVVASSPAEFASFMEKESAKWGRVVREANIKPE